LRTVPITLSTQNGPRRVDKHKQDSIIRCMNYEDSKHLDTQIALLRARDRIRELEKQNQELRTKLEQAVRAAATTAPER